MSTQYALMICWMQISEIHFSELLCTFFPSLSSLKNLNNTSPRQIMQLISGHWSLNGFLHKMKQTSSPRCRFCLNSDETVEHFIFFCPYFDQHRNIFKHLCLKITKSWPPTPSLIPQSTPLWRSFINFIVSSKRFFIRMCIPDVIICI